jgi:hypothetical protein
MSNLRAAAQQALGALEFIPASGSMLGALAEEKRVQTIDALRAALEQEEQESPRREWVSLTENELGELMRDSCGYPMCPNGDDLAFARAIEAALKERNHG